MANHSPNELPDYLIESDDMLRVRSKNAKNFARLTMELAKTRLAKPFSECKVLDVGSGWGHIAAELSFLAASVTAIEPNPTLYSYAVKNCQLQPESKLRFLEGTVETVEPQEQFDVAIMDNVLEHIPNQVSVLKSIHQRLNHGGVLVVIVPNKLWPIEVHYHLPFLSYLPLSLANRYLKWSGKGEDFTDASYQPTYWSLKRIFSEAQGYDLRYVVPKNVGLAAKGDSIIYHLGAKALRTFPRLWALSKALVVVAKKDRP